MPKTNKGHQVKNGCDARRYYSLAQSGSVANIDIYGDITSWPWCESDVSAFSLSQVLKDLDGVETINVNINSYGGEVAEGLAIYNALKRHNAKVITRCDGFACSIASVIFSAGDERIMHDASLLMIHNAWIYASGNADDLRKQADDLDTITQAAKNAYMANINISEDKLTDLMDNESWISPQDALEMGFATDIEAFDTDGPSQNARAAVCGLIMGSSTDCVCQDGLASAQVESEQTQQPESSEPHVNLDVSNGTEPPCGQEQLDAQEPPDDQASSGAEEESSIQRSAAEKLADFFMTINL